MTKSSLSAIIRPISAYPQASGADPRDVFGRRQWPKFQEQHVQPQANINIDDNTLVQQCQWGDPKAMEHLVLKYQDRIYNTILKICANTDDAAELTQETFVKIIENIGKFEARSSFYTWAFRIAVNLTLNHCKRGIKLGFRSLDSENADNVTGRNTLRELLADDTSQDPAEIIQNTELCEIVLTALTQLEDAQRAVVILRDIEGMNYAQIAKTLDIELGTVRSRLSRARNNLREIMEAMVQ